MRKPPTKATIPSDLKRKISPAMLYFLGTPGIFFRIMLIALSAVSLHGGSDPNGLMYLAGAFICPTAVAAFCSFVPLKPYRGTLYLEKVHDVDRSDPAVMRLGELFRSNEARRHIWLKSTILFPVLFIGGLAFRLGQPARWSFTISALHSPCAVCLVMCFAISFTLLAGDHTAWAVKTWASREASRQPIPQ
jgi:hypothetical protein